MNRKTISIFLACILLFLLVSCEPSMPNKYPNAQVTKTEAGNILIVTEDFSAVILTKENMEVFPFENPKIQYSTPTVKQILYIETNLFDFLSKHDAAFNSSHAPSRDELAKFGRQYFRATTPDDSLIYGRFFCDPESFDWKSRFVDMIGGGECYFTVMFDPEILKFEGVYVNSPK